MLAAFDSGKNNISLSGEDMLSVDYSRLVPLLIEAIKELTSKVETLESEV